MEPTPVTNVSMFSDADLVELTASSSSTWNNQKRKRTVGPTEIVDVDEDDNPKEIVLIDEPAETTSNSKMKQPMTPTTTYATQLKASLFSNHVGTIGNPIDNAPLGAPTSSKGVSLDFKLLHGYCTYDDYEDEDDDDYLDEFEDDDYDEEYNLSLVAKFDNLDLPPGVGTSAPKSATEDADVIDIKYITFKQFDIVEGDDDHYFNEANRTKRRSHHVVIHGQGGRVEKIAPKDVKEPTKEWAKRIQHEWKVLEENLPENIHVRVYEDKMALLRAVIVGPAGTPYHDGLFFFDAYFPYDYPNVPPEVHYHSGGLRLNPNLYNCGKVCLSLLGTWAGEVCESWDKSRSTMLQVLVSIQALILNEKPYFNEPGRERYVGEPRAEERSLRNNEETYLLSCKTMIYTLQRPPKHFEDFVVGYFRKKGSTILAACRAYLDGVLVGGFVAEETKYIEDEKGCSDKFRNSLKILFNDLMTRLNAIGVDCDKFRVPEVEGAGECSGTTLKLG